MRPGGAPRVVFVYGTLRDPDRVGAVLEDWEFVGQATLQGLHRVEGTYPTLGPGGTVAGRLLRTAEMDRLDAYEGVADGCYVRVAVPVVGRSVDRRRVETASVYVGDPARLGADVSWPGRGSLADRVRRYVEDRDVAVVPAESHEGGSAYRQR